MDRLAKEGDPLRFRFSKPRLEAYDYSFSGLKTSFRYFLRDQVKVDASFVENNISDLAASLQYTIVSILMDKLKKAVRDTGVKRLALAGGVSANSGLRLAMEEEALRQGWNLHIPPFRFTTDNAAMIAISGYYKYLDGNFAPEDVAPMARMHF